jgi:hypothetical protein
MAFDFEMFNLAICASTVLPGVLIDQEVRTVRVTSVFLGAAWKFR